MIKFVKTNPATKPKTAESQQIAYAYTGVLVLFVLAQLFTFDEFLVLLNSFWLPGGKPVAHLLGGVIVSSELLALPFLLRQNLSTLMRIFSMTLGWIVPFIWLILSIWLVFTVNVVSNLGIFGTVIVIMPGWWTVFLCIALVIMSAWASWGLWPVKRK